MLEKQNDRNPDPFAEALERYIGETLHDPAHVTVYRASSRLPAFLERTYKLYKATIAGRLCLFLAAGERTPSPADIAKHVGLIRPTENAIIVFAAPSLSAHNRTRLIKHRIPFVVPGNQLYIPDLAMDLREHFRALKPRRTEGLTPAAQAVLFYHLLRPDAPPSSPSVIAEHLRYSAMSIGRAFDDLATLGLAVTEKHGKERHIRFKAQGRQLLDLARGYLRSPVRGVKYLKGRRGDPRLQKAGQSALAALTELSKPPIDTYAVAASAWKEIARARHFVETDEYGAEFILETWSYDPLGLSDKSTVDPLSLYAQFRDHNDERVAGAAEDLLGEISW